MKKYLVFLALFTLIVIAIAHARADFTPGVPTFQWDSQVTSSSPFRQSMFAGETANFECRLLQYSAPFLTTNGTPAAFYWQTDEMAEIQWIKEPATVSQSGVCRAAFTARQPGQVRFFFRVGEPEGVNYRANGFLTIARSPGAKPNAIPLPPPYIDFANTEVFNEPWPSRAEVQTVATETTAALAREINQRGYLTPDATNGLLSAEAAANLANLATNAPINPARLPDHSITSTQLGFNAVGTASLAPNAVTTDKLAPSVSSAITAAQNTANAATPRPTENIGSPFQYVWYRRPATGGANPVPASEGFESVFGLGEMSAYFSGTRSVTVNSSPANVSIVGNTGKASHVEIMAKVDSVITITDTMLLGAVPIFVRLVGEGGTATIMLPDSQGDVSVSVAKGKVAVVMLMSIGSGYSSKPLTFLSKIIYAD